MGKKSKFEYFKAIYHRYRDASHQIKQVILNEFCRVCGYNRKYAIRKLHGPPPEELRERDRTRDRDVVYSGTALDVIGRVWEASGYPWSQRLTAILRDWMPWIRRRYKISPAVEKELLSISARQIDRRLKNKKDMAKRRMYGRTKPGNLLRHQIPIRTDYFDVDKPGYEEIDTLSHSGDCAEGDFAYTVNQTDISSVWTESVAVLGKGEDGVVRALAEMRDAVPFDVIAYDPDNGSEFINWHMVKFCREKHLALTRSREYKKDDQAHIEQKNYTHVRKLIGYDRYDSQCAVDAMNDLYRNELRLYMNLFMPSVKLERKVHIGSRLVRRYDDPQTPLQRLLASGGADPRKLKELKELHDSLDPFLLAKAIDAKLAVIYRLANRKKRTPNLKYPFLTQSENNAMEDISKVFPGAKPAQIGGPRKLHS